MRYAQGALVGLVAAGLVGCSNAASGPPSANSSLVAPHGSASAARPAPGKAAQPTATTGSAAAHDNHDSTRTRASAHAAMARFNSLYFSGQFAVSWDLLARSVKREIPQRVWVKVHEGCPTASPGKPRVITDVTVFGDAAIGAEVLGAGRTDIAFHYAHGYWGYTPNDPSIYGHGSAAADIAAARAAGLCASWKGF